MMRFLLLFCFCAAAVCGADEKGFSQRLSAEDYKAAGLDKLSDEERVRLDALVAKQTERAGSVAVAAATAKPVIIRGKISGVMPGWSQGTILAFEDGRRWEVVSEGSYRAAPVRRSPEAELFPLSDGTYIMTVKTVPRRLQVKPVTEPAAGEK